MGKSYKYTCVILSIAICFIGPVFTHNGTETCNIGDLGADFFSNVFSASRIAELIHLFSTRFHKMSIKYNKVLTNRVFSVGAYHNHRMALQNLISINQSNLINIHVRLSDADIRDLENFSATLNVAENANQISPGTVETFIFEYPIDPYQQSLVLNYASEFANTTLQAGIHVYPSLCQQGTHTEFLHRVEKLRIILVDVPWRDRYHVLGAQQSVLEMETLIDKCVRTLAFDNIQVAFYTTWPDTNSFAMRRNQSELLKFWRGMAEASKKFDVTVFMDQAFDLNNDGARDIFNSNGWWTRNRREKVTDPEDSLLLPDGLEHLVCEGDPVITGINYFKNNNINTRFPYISALFNQNIRENDLSREELFPYLSVVSQRFPNLVYFVDRCDLSPRSSDGAIQFKPLEAIAVWNKISKTCDMENTVIQVTIAVAIDLSDTVTSNSCFESIMTISSFFNDIHPRTINKILLDLNMPEETVNQSWDNSARFLRDNLARLQTNGIDLGVIESAEKFSQHRFFIAWATNIYPHVNHVYLHHDLCSDEESHSQSLIAVSNIASLQNSIQGALNRRRTSLKMGIYVKFLQAGCNNGTVDHIETTNFWLTLDTFSQQNQIPFIIGPVLGKVNVSIGEWFRHSLHGSRHIVSEGFPNLYPGDSNNKSDSNMSEEEPKSGSPWAVPITVILVFVTIVVVLRRIKTRITRRQSQAQFAEEAKDFQQVTQIPNTYATQGTTQSVICMTYDMSLEVSSKNYTIENERSLGSGAFGCVTLAKIIKNGVTTWVAAKTVKCIETRNAAVLRSLLMEIKVSSYLGKHPSITQLLGAYTKEANSGKVFAFYELCHLGSLHNFLRGKTQFNSSDAHNESDYLNLTAFEVPVQELLMKWSIEIADGMEYISSKYIVHGDLATRNVLLDKARVAKICDFGLSRRMENYQNYVKQNSEPLPWRWMAYESLTGLEFSSKSDVWSFGVTLWEIFSEGEVPYPGLQWTPEFAGELKTGMRLPKPPDAPNEMYELMRSCWETAPGHRPGFEEIKHHLMQLFGKMPNESSV